MRDLLFFKHHVHPFEEMALLLRLEHHLDMHAFLGTQPTFIFTQIKALSFVRLLGLNEPVYVELVGIPDLEGSHEAGLAFAKNASIKGNVVRL